MAPQVGKSGAHQRQVRLQVGTRRFPFEFLSAAHATAAQEAQGEADVIGTRTTSRSLADDFHTVISELFLSSDLAGSDTKNEQVALLLGVERMAKAGALGLLPGKLSSDLIRQFPSVSFANMQAWDCKRHQPATYLMPFLLVHKVLVALALKSSDFVALCCSRLS